MEHHTRFDLNAALARWSAALALRGTLEPGKIAELESHLSDSVADLQRRGLDEAESFLIAARRLGSPAQIEQEFEKAEDSFVPRRALSWLVLGATGWITLGGALGILENLLVFAGSSFAPDQTTLAVLVCVAKILSLGLLAKLLLDVARQGTKLQTLVHSLAQRPWLFAGLMLLTHGLLFFTSSISRILIFRQNSPAFSAQFAMFSSITSLVSSVIALGILGFFLVKTRPAQPAS